MKLFIPEAVGGPKPPDELDGLLRAYFRAQLPDPWPSLEAPAALPPRKPAARRSVFRARLALAASVALLAGGSFLLPRAFHDGGGAAPTPRVASPGASKTYRDPAAPPTKADDGYKINESLIQEPGGTKLKVDVIPMPANPK
jgi:hypothetical protein